MRRRSREARRRSQGRGALRRPVQVGSFGTSLTARAPLLSVDVPHESEEEDHHGGAMAGSANSCGSPQDGATGRTNRYAVTSSTWKHQPGTSRGSFPCELRPLADIAPEKQRGGDSS